MRLLFWLRALWGFNFFNWDRGIDFGDYEVAVNLRDLKYFNIGQQYTITSVNRTTGKLTLKQH